MSLAAVAMASAARDVVVPLAPPSHRVGTVLPWLVGLGVLAAVVAGALHVSEAEDFLHLVRESNSRLLIVAAALQALTYLAQGQVWRTAGMAAGCLLRRTDASRLSLAKLFADQALPSGGVSGTVVVASGLERRGVPRASARAAVLVNLVAYHVAYLLCLTIALVILEWRGNVHPLVLVISAAFALFAVALSGGVMRWSGGSHDAIGAAVRRVRLLRGALDFVESSEPTVVRNPALLFDATVWQIAIVALDAATMWTLLRAVGAEASIPGVFASFMVASLVRTVGVIPGGLGTFEATSVLALALTGSTVAEALAATLLFRGLSFWLPMVPGFLVSRRELRTDATESEVDRYWGSSIDNTLAAQAATRTGLMSGEVAKRRLIHGANAIGRDHRTSLLYLIGRQFANPLLGLLLFAVVASMASGEWLDSAIVLVIVVVSVGVTASREFSAHTVAAALRQRLHATAQVIRDGVSSEIALEAVVPGDIVLLSAGRLVPADAVVIEASHCFVNEAPLTGESFPVAKGPGLSAGDTPLHERANCVFMGTAVQSGSARAVAVRTGMNTELGRLAGRLADRAPETEFERGLRQFGYLLMTTMLLMVIVVFVTHVLRGRPASETLLFSVALAVGLSPELLPAILSINLARDAQVMARRGVLVRRLNAIENLGSMDVLCTDKTGTLTEGNVRFQSSCRPDGEVDPDVLALAVTNARLSTGIPGPLDAAILAAAPAATLPEKLAEIPFDSARRRVSVVVTASGQSLLITKGAFHAISAASSSANGTPLDEPLRQRLGDAYEAWASQGIRVVAVATRALERRSSYGPDDETALDFRGFITFVDRVKDDAADTIAALRALGVSVVLITGDNALVAAHVARGVGLVGNVVNGDDLAGLPQDALARLAERTQVFAELDPAQKERVVTALRKAGHVVGFLGDGINDVAAMHAADTSLAVDTAIDVARQAADFVLLERGLDVIRRGIEEGRRTFANTLKYILITMSANLGNMLSMAAASLVLPFLPMLAGQVLLNNFLSDIPAVGLARDRVDRELVESPRRWDVTAIGHYMVRFGLLSSAFDVATFAVLLYVFHAVPAEFRTAWFVESLLTELVVALIVRTRRPIHESRPGALLLGSTVAVAAIALAIPYVPAATLLGFVPLPFPVVAAIIAITGAYVVAAEAAKRRLTTI